MIFRVMLVLWLLVRFPTMLHAATFVVDTTVDDYDANPGDGICATSGGMCSLRAALQTANLVAGADMITVPAGTYPLQATAVVDIDVTDDVTLVGAGVAATTIEGPGFGSVLGANDADLDIRDLTIRNGRVGVVLNDGSLTLTRVSVTENGSGVSILANTIATTCLVTDSTISNNQNPSNTSGGGLLARNSGAQPVSLTIRRSTISGNYAFFGGGINGSAALDIDESTIAGNSAVDGGGIWTPAGILTLRRSTVVGNSALGNGGGIIAAGAGLIENTTISGNSANVSAGGLTGGGTGLRIRNVTITGNVADADDDGDGDGGGFTGSNEISNSIIAGNVDRGGEADDCAGAITSGGYNLIERAEACFITGDLSGNVLGLPAMVGPLAMNGGPTETHALLPGSPALDAGNPILPGGAPPACAATDQRAVGRPHGDGCDLGAVEQGYVITNCGNGTVDGGEQCDDGNVRNGDCCTGSCQLDGAGTPCADANSCTDNVCDGAGACNATNNSAPCEDNLFCTDGDTCSGGSCTSGPPRDCDDQASCSTDFCHPTYGCQHAANDGLCDDGDPCSEDFCDYLTPDPGTGCRHFATSGAACDDGSLCTTADVCQFGTCIGQGQLVCDDCLSCDPGSGCTVLGPEPTCNPTSKSGQSSLSLRDAANPAADSLQWSWKSQDGTSLTQFGMPTQSTTYDLCIYDQSSGTPSLLLRASPAVGLCGTSACWRTTLKSHAYKDRDRSADGLASIKLQSAFPKASITLSGKGEHVPPFTLPTTADPALVVQLRSSNGGCWGASFSAPAIHTAERFKAKSD